MQHHDGYHPVRDGRDREARSLAACGQDERAERHQLAAAQEEERLHLARMLHDQIGQQVTGLLLGLKRLEQELQDTPWVDMLPPLQNLAGELARETHRVAQRLWPTGLADLGLVPMLEHLVADWSRETQVVGMWYSYGLDQQRLPRLVEITLYRVVQEALTNVRKHAHAPRVEVIAERYGDMVVVIVEDNGCGYDPDAVAHKGEGLRMGLLRLHAQITQLGGILAIESAPGKGTTLIVRIPIDDDGPAS